jgi:hypothetical protein
METPEGRSPVYNIVGFAIAGLIVVAAVALVIVLAPALKRTTPLERVVGALKTQFPGSAPEVKGPDSSGALRISLKVPFDPTVQWKQAQGTFDRAAAVTEAEKLSGIKTTELTLVGVSVEGHPTSVSRTLDYEPPKVR